MKYLIFIFLLILAFSCKAQVKLTQVEKSTVKWDLPVAKRVIPGQTGFFQTYMDLNDLIDSLGISFGTVIDSMKYESDTLKLYTSDGIFSAEIVGSGGGGLGGSGTTNYVSKFTSSTNLGNSQIFDDGSNVSINDATPNAKLDVHGDSGYLIGLFKETGVTEEAQLSGNEQETVSIQGSGAANLHLREVGSNVDAMFGVNTSNAYLGSASSHGLDLITGNNQRLNISNGGLVKINNLSGSGTRAVTANATGELGTTILGTVSSIATTSPITGGTITTTGTIGIQNATTAQTGALTSTDWNTFNNKMSSFLLAASGTGGSQSISSGNTVTITGGSGITATRSGSNVTIASSGGSGTVTSIATNNGITGGVITTSGTVGLTGNALGLHNLSSNGILVRTSAGNIAARTILGGSGISVTNGTGVSGDITITSTVANQNLTYTTGTGLIGITSGTGIYIPTAYRAVGYNSDAIQPITLSGSYVIIPFGTVQWTTVNGVSAFSSSSNLITPALTGQYLVTYKVSVTRPNGSSSRVALYRGTLRMTDTETVHAGSTTQEAIHSGSFVVSLTNTQNISLRLLTADSGNAGLRGAHIQITKIQ